MMRTGATTRTVVAVAEASINRIHKKATSWVAFFDVQTKVVLIQVITLQ